VSQDTVYIYICVLFRTHRNRVRVGDGDNRFFLDPYCFSGGREGHGDSPFKLYDIQLVKPFFGVPMSG